MDFLLGTDQSVVREEQDRPAFIQQVQEAAQIIIRDLVGGFSILDHFALVITGGVAVFHVLHVIVALQIHIVEVGKDDLYPFMLNEVVHAFALPVSSQLPLLVVALEDEIFVIAAHLTSRLRRPKEGGELFEERFGEPHRIILAGHPAGGPDANIAAVLGDLEHAHIAVDPFFTAVGLG